MIIQCPACATKYVVPDSALSADGRTVRCAKCRHSWHQEGPVLDLKPQSEVSQAEVPQTDSPVRSEAAAPEAPQAAPKYSVREDPVQEAPVRTPPVYDSEGDAPHKSYSGSQFDAAPPFRRRRNPLKMWTWAAGVFAASAAALIFAVSYWGLPNWVPVSRPTFAAAQPDLQLDFPADQQERRQLPNGTEFFGASGTITNTGSTAQSVPSILIVLRDAKERIVYSWEVAPSKRTLAPGESLSVDEAVTDVPRSARIADIGWKPE